MSQPKFSIAVFPFLKTHASIRIGGYTFRSTNDKEDFLLEASVGDALGR